MEIKEIAPAVRVSYSGWDFRTSAMGTHTGTVKRVGKGSNPLVTIIPDAPEAHMNPNQTYPKAVEVKSRISDIQAI